MSPPLVELFVPILAGQCVAAPNVILSFVDNNCLFYLEKLIILHFFLGHSCALKLTPAGVHLVYWTCYFWHFVSKRALGSDSCVNPNCTWNSMSALLALQDETNVIQTLDYRPGGPLGRGLSHQGVRLTRF